MKKKSKWNGVRSVPFNVGRLTRNEISEIERYLEISEFVFQRTMSYMAKNMGGKYYDGVISIDVAPFEIHVHYLKYPDEDGVIAVSWMVYPKGKRNASKMYKVFSSPVEGSGYVWPKFVKWMETIVEAVNIIRATKGREVEGLELGKFSSKKARKHERNRKSRI